MASTQRKDFFKDLTPGQVKRLGERIEVSNVEEAVAVHTSKKGQDYYVQIMERTIPKGHSPRSYQKYGPITWTREFGSVEECLEAKTHPWELMRDAVNAMEEPTIGIGHLPPLEENGKPIRDNTLARVIAWKEIFEGARVFAYAHQSLGMDGEPVGIDLRRGRTNAKIYGAQMHGTIPSRRKHVGRWKVQLHSVPATAVHAYTDKEVAARQFYIPLTFTPFNVAEKSFYRRLQTTERSGQYIPIMWNDAALYFEYMQQDVDELKEQKETMRSPPTHHPPSIEFTPIPLVTRSSVEVYMKFLNQTLNHKGQKLRDAELNLCIGELAKNWKYMRTFYSKMSRDGRLAEYKWGLPVVEAGKKL
jgi:hypothetical protein